MFVVELEENVWIAPWHGDPGRTVLLTNAQTFNTKHGARVSLGMARRYRKFKNAKVVSFNNAQQTKAKIKE